MRQIGLSDLYHAARAVLSVPPPQREACCDLLLWRAHVADKYIKRLGKFHPEWGNGSVRSAALGMSVHGEMPQGSAELCAGVQIVLKAVARRQKAKNL